MTRSNAIVRPLVLAVLVAGTAPSFAQEAGYCFHQLGTFGGPRSHAYGINDVDPPQVTGHADVPNGRHRGYVYQDWNASVPLDMAIHGLEGGGVIDGCTNEPQCNTTAMGINDHGFLAGVGTLPTTHHATMFPPLVDLGTLDATPDAESYTRDVNESDELVGKSELTVDGALQTHAFFFDGVLVDLDPGSPLYSEANAIDDAGRVVGMRDGYATAWHRSGASWEREAIDPHRGSNAWDVDGESVVVGESASGPVAWKRVARGWSRRELGPAGGVGAAYGVNASESIVGTLEIDGVPHAHLWSPVDPHSGEWTAVDLNADPAMPAGWVMTEARSINEAGWIVGKGFPDADGDGRLDADEFEVAIVLQPVEDRVACR